MAFKDVIKGILRDLPPPARVTDETLIKRFAESAPKKCPCGFTFIPRGEQKICGRCLEGLA